MFERQFYGQPRMLPGGSPQPQYRQGQADRFAALRHAVAGTPLPALQDRYPQQRYQAQPAQQQMQQYAPVYASRPADLAQATSFWGQRLQSMSPSDPQYGDVQKLADYFGGIQPAVNPGSAQPMPAGGPATPSVSWDPTGQSYHPSMRPGGYTPMPAGSPTTPLINFPSGARPGSTAMSPMSVQRAQPPVAQNPLWPSNPANVAPNQQITPGYVVQATHRPAG